MPRPAGRRRPCRPGEERGQLVRLRRVVDRIGAQALLGRRVGEVVGVVALELRECLGLRLGVGERVGLLVVAVRLEVGDRLLARPIGSGAAVLALDGFRRAVEVVGGAVGPEVGAVAEDRAVLHQPVVEEDLLAPADVLAGEERLPLGVDDPVGDRGVGAVGPVGEQPEDEEADQEDDDRGLDPALRDQELTALRALLRHRRPAI